MADESRLLNLSCKFLRFLPDVQHANWPVTFRQKVIYTTISLFIFLVGSQIPLYGIQHATEADPLYSARLVFASNRDTLMMLGIAPILIPEMITRCLVVRKIIDMDNSAPEADMRLNKARKLLGILFTIVEAIIYVLSTPGTGNAALIMLQIFFSGIVVIYLDDLLRTGYGLLSGIPLFTATNFCGVVVWKALSPCTIAYHEQDTEIEGAIIALIHLLITRTDKLSAIHEAFYRKNLPNVISLLATCLFFPIAIFFHGISVMLPVRVLDHFQVNYPIKLSHISYAPIVLHRPLLSLFSTISEVLFMKFGENKFMNLLGNWKGSKHFGHYPVGGIAYYLSTPPTFVDLWRDPVHTFMYMAFVLTTCALTSEVWFEACVSSERFFTGLFRENVWRQGYIPTQRDAMPVGNYFSYLSKTARFGGFCVGVLIIWADLTGVIGRGVGVMLAVSAVYPYIEGRAGELRSAVTFPRVATVDDGRPF